MFTLLSVMVQERSLEEYLSDACRRETFTSKIIHCASLLRPRTNSFWSGKSWSVRNFNFLLSFPNPTILASIFVDFRFWHCNFTEILNKTHHERKQMRRAKIQIRIRSARGCSWIDKLNMKSWCKNRSTDYSILKNIKFGSIFTTWM